MRIRWNDLTPEQQEERKAEWERLDAFMSAASGERSPFHRHATDAGIALRELAEEGDYTGRYRDVAEWITEVYASVERSGSWTSDNPDFGPQWIQRDSDGFSVGVDLSCRFRMRVATFGEAWEAVRVLFALGLSLAHALSVPSRRETPSLEPEPDRSITEAYLKGLARETPTHVPSKGASIATAPPPPPSEWEDPVERIYVVTVRRESLILECDCTTPERANLFLAVFDMLSADLLDILDWKPLPATD
jgi:hypothetical protein